MIPEDVKDIVQRFSCEYAPHLREIVQLDMALAIAADRARLPRQDDEIRKAALEERKDRERQIRVSEYRRAVQFLHKLADQMNDLHARAVLNLAADELGRARSQALREAGHG